MRMFFIDELELKNYREAVETSFVFLIACFYSKMFYLELITSYIGVINRIVLFLLVQPNYDHPELILSMTLFGVICMLRLTKYAGLTKYADKRKLCIFVLRKYLKGICPRSSSHRVNTTQGTCPRNIVPSCNSSGEFSLRLVLAASPLECADLNTE